MAGTRTAPTVDGSETYKNVSMSFVDADKSEVTITFRADSTVINSEVETLAAAVAAATNSSLWKVCIVDIYEGAKLASNGASDDIVSVKDQVRLSFKEIASGATIRAYLPAPLAQIVGPGPVVVTDQALYTAWRNAALAIIPTTFGYLNTSYVQNVQRNQAQDPTAT